MPAPVCGTRRPVPAQMLAAVVTPSSDQGARGSLRDCASSKVRAMDEDTQHQLHTSTHVHSYTEAGIHTYVYNTQTDLTDSSHGKDTCCERGWVTSSA